MCIPIIRLNEDNIGHEHICCALSDKKCRAGYDGKKAWLSAQFDQGYEFRRMDMRAKVFIEYCPVETGWLPLIAPDYLSINCFWVSGQYKGRGYGKRLLQQALDDAAAQGKKGLVTVAGVRNFIL